MAPVPRRAAFTLFEVAISLALLAVAIVGAMLIFPNGIRAQQYARFRLYASTKALEMVEAFQSFPTAMPSLESEAPDPWDVGSERSNMAFDLERRLSSYRFGIMPVPLTIARRIDSDGDEIRDLLDDGGYVYYSQPRATSAFLETSSQAAPPNEAQRVLIGVVGLAQSNAINVFPWKAWPYYVPWPSPPAHGTHAREDGFSLRPGSLETPTYGQNTYKLGFLWEDTSDADIRQVFESEVGDATPGAARPKYGYKPHFLTWTGDSAKRYCQAALWYCARKGIDPALYDTTAPVTAFAPGMPVDERWKPVQALRFLAHAAACMTTYFSGADLRAGIALDPVDVLGDGATTSPAFTLTEAKILALHESALNLGMLFAASHPYDWAVPRPLQRAIMMDHPLIEHDLFTPPLAGSIFATGENAEQWRPLPATPITHIGRSFQFMDDDIPSTRPQWRWWGAAASAPAAASGFWGDQAHVTLTRRFSPDERCRQLVFWAVDWMAYEDCETAPSAPVDAGRYPRGAPRQADAGDFIALMDRPPFFDWQQYVFRNPEKILCFRDRVDALPTGADVRDLVIGPQLETAADPLRPERGREDQRPANAKDTWRRFSGAFGADRNFDGRLDRGPLPRSQRLRAITVARFDFYDPRLPVTLR